MRSRSQPKEDENSPFTRTAEYICPTSYHHWKYCTKTLLTVDLFDHHRLFDAVRLKERVWKRIAWSTLIKPLYLPFFSTASQLESPSTATYNPLSVSINAVFTLSPATIVSISSRMSKFMNRLIPQHSSLRIKKPFFINVCRLITIVCPK